jgi:hypothetical protein
MELEVRPASEVERFVASREPMDVTAAGGLLAIG